MSRLFLAVLALILSIPGGETSPVAVPGNWQPVKDRTYVGTALYGYMNGGSDEYYGYGFQCLRVLTLSSDGHGYTVEIFRMDTPENARGIYLQHTFKPLRENALELADCDFLSKYQLQAVCGADYISIIFEDGPGAAPGAGIIMNEYLSLLRPEASGEESVPHQ